MFTYKVEELETHPVSAVRFTIGDTDPDHYYLEDEEIAFVGKGRYNMSDMAVVCVRRIIAKVAKEVAYTIGPEQVEAQQRLSNFQALLEELLLEAHATKIRLSQPCTHSPIFELGQFDNQNGRSIPWTRSLERDF